VAAGSRWIRKRHQRVYLPQHRGAEGPDSRCCGSRRAADRAGKLPALHLSYSFATPFSASPDYKLSLIRSKFEFAIMRTKTPAFPSTRRAASANRVQRANSRNHAQSGQNVLYTNGQVNWQWTPYCAAGNDNIFCAAQAADDKSKHNQRYDHRCSACKRRPANAADSFLSAHTTRRAVALSQYARQW
jgi:hypothetical protein